MSVCEQAVIFFCAGEELLGIVAVPQQPTRTGVLIVVGGPQYRVGSHRQFLLLSRALAIAGYPAMRFDYRGMGDSSGAQHNFETVDDDIAAAIEAFFEHCPQMEQIVLLGLCDAASACLLYLHSHRDERLGGVVLLNPWVRSDATLARAHIKYYYAHRLLQPAFWRKLLSGNLGVGRALRGLFGNLNSARQVAVSANNKLSFQEKMRCALAETELPALLILSGDDFTAKEFIEATRIDSVWQKLMVDQRLTRNEIVGADHTFSTQQWRVAVEKSTLSWLEKVGKK